MLSASTVRQLACDADIIPIVLGAHSEILDLGRAVRLYTRGQRLTLWHRDHGCTFPGCDHPASWTKAHHIIHWADGGPSNLTNAALLCQRHHTQVHEQRLIATIGPPDTWGRCVTWDLTPHSYDRDLPQRLTQLRHSSPELPDAHDPDSHDLDSHDLAVGADLTDHDLASSDDLSERVIARLLLDTGPPDPWTELPPDDIQQHLIDDALVQEARHQHHPPPDHATPWDDLSWDECA